VPGRGRNKIDGLQQSRRFFATVNAEDEIRGRCASPVVTLSVNEIASRAFRNQSPSNRQQGDQQ
jgi:hypothetical protein